VDTLTIHEGFDLGGGWDGGAATTTTAPCRLPGSPPCRPSRGGCGPLTEDQWPQGLKALRAYVGKHGTARVPLGAMHRRYPVGRWVSARRAQYKRGTLTPAKISTLQAFPGWVWDVKQSRWEQGLRLLVAYAQRTGLPNPDSFYVEDREDGFTLGAWAMSRRKEYRLGVLSPIRVSALEAIPGWEWNPYDAAWHRMFDVVEREAHQRGSIAPIGQRDVIDGVNVGYWVMAQRSKHRQHRLAPDRATALETLPGWAWAPRASP